MKLRALRVSIFSSVSLLLGCGDKPNESAKQQPISYASREPGSHATPTTKTSFDLLAAEPVVRWRSSNHRSQFRANSVRPSQAACSSEGWTEQMNGASIAPIRERGQFGLGQMASLMPFGARTSIAARFSEARTRPVTISIAASE
jgi:hypothetical protein